MERPRPLPKKHLNSEGFTEQHTEMSAIFKHTNTKIISMIFFFLKRKKIQEVYTYFSHLTQPFHLWVHIYNISDSTMH